MGLWDVGKQVLGTVLDPFNITPWGAGNRAAEKAAQEQKDFAFWQRDEARKAAAPTDNELKVINDQVKMFERGVALAEANIMRQENLLRTIDPALLETGNQLLAILKGGNNEYTDMISRQRQEQKITLQNRLKEELGGGFASSSAGSRALNRFDQGTVEARMQGLNTFGNLFSSLQNNQSGAMSSMFGGMNSAGQLGTSVLSGQNAISGRMINALTGNPVAQYGGASQTAEYMASKNMQSLLTEGLKMAAKSQAGGAG